MRKVWRPEEDEYLREFGDLGADRLAAHFGCTVASVCDRASKIKAPIGRMHPRRLLAHPIAFMSRVEFDTNGGCWFWSGSATQAGYGSLNGHTLAHRHSWTIFRGPIPDGLVVCHRCDTPACVNPAHLFLGTNADNFADMIGKRRHRFGERAPNAKINEAQAATIIALLHERVGIKEIAERIGCSRQTVTNIQSNGAWSHVGTAPKPLGRSVSMRRVRKANPTPQGTDGRFVSGPRGFDKRPMVVEE